MRKSAALSVILALGACTRATAPSAESVEPAEEVVEVEPVSHQYSPYVVRMSTELPFGLISFKDVGMSLPENARPQVYEEVAQSLAVALSKDAGLPLMSTVEYDLEMADPAHHLMCGYEQVYVDVWAPQGVERWGYSLWSGCAEEDRFAHREVERKSAEDIEALTRDIAISLRTAVQTGCFISSC